jgi:hypothetical protein
MRSSDAVPVHLAPLAPPARPHRLARCDRGGLGDPPRLSVATESTRLVVCQKGGGDTILLARPAGCQTSIRPQRSRRRCGRDLHETRTPRIGTDRFPEGGGAVGMAEAMPHSSSVSRAMRSNAGPDRSVHVRKAILACGDVCTTCACGVSRRRFTGPSREQSHGWNTAILRQSWVQRNRA